MKVYEERPVRPVIFTVAFFVVAASAAHAQIPAVTQGGVVNAASNTGTVAPGQLVSIYGTNLAETLTKADTVPLSTELGDVSVTFNGISTPLLFVSASQINAQLPWNVLSSGTTGTATVAVKRK